MEQFHVYLQHLQANNEWIEKTFSNSVPRCCFILLHVMLFAALFLTEPRWEKHSPQSPWEHSVWWCSSSLHALCLFPLGFTSSPLATALMAPKCCKCHQRQMCLETKCLGKWTEVVWGCRELVHPAWGYPTSPTNVKMPSELLFFLDCVVSLQNSSHKPLLDDFLTLKKFMWPVLLGRTLCLRTFVLYSLIKSGNHIKLL